MENVYKENKIKETQHWNILGSGSSSEGESSEGDLSDNSSEKTTLTSDQTRRLSIRKTVLLREINLLGHFIVQSG